MKHYWEIWGVAFIATMLFCGMMIWNAATADAKPGWSRAKATWYGPGFYGNTTACGHRYSIKHRGVAVPVGGPYRMKCGTKLTICRASRCVRVHVTDTGGFRNHRFDLSARTAMDLCRCWKPYTMKVRWRLGWAHRGSGRSATEM